MEDERRKTKEERRKTEILRLILALFVVFCFNFSFNPEKAYASDPFGGSIAVSKYWNTYGQHFDFDLTDNSHTAPNNYSKYIIGYCDSNGRVIQGNSIVRNLRVWKVNGHTIHVSFDFYPDWNALEASAWDGHYHPLQIRGGKGQWNVNTCTWIVSLYAVNSITYTASGNGHNVRQGLPYGDTWSTYWEAHTASGWGWDGNYHRRYCTKCGAWTESHVCTANYSWVTDANTHVMRCNIDGITWNSGTHSMGGWYGNTATCTAGGLQYRSCGTCGYTISSATSALGHSWSAEYADSDGYIKKKCTRCNEVQVLRGIDYSVLYNGNGSTRGSTEKSSHQYGVAKNLTKNGYEKTGYSFTGWNTIADISGTHYEDEASVINLTTTHNGTVSLYAEWKINQYPVKYIIHDITTDTDIKMIIQDVDYNVTVNGTDIDQELNVNTDGIFYVENDSRPYKLLTEDDDETLYTTAKVSTAGATVYRYCRLNEIDLTFDENTPSGKGLSEALVPSSKKVVPGKTYGDLPTPKLSDWKFEGWFTEKTGGTKITSSSIVDETQAFSIYAHWTALPPSIVSYDKSAAVVEDLGITEEEYLKSYGNLTTDFLQNGKLLYPYQTTTIEATIDGGQSSGTRNWTWEMKRNGKWISLVGKYSTTANINGITYETRNNKDVSKVYLDITGAIRTDNNTEYRLRLKNNAAEKLSDTIPLTVYWLPKISGNTSTKSYTHLIEIRYENADGSFGDYETVYLKRVLPNKIVSWSLPGSNMYKEASVEYRTTEEDVTTKIDIMRQTYYLDINGRLGGKNFGNIKHYGKCDVYINGELKAKGVTDYYVKWRYGTTYEIKDIVPDEGHIFNGCYNKIPLAGEINKTTSLVLEFD